MAYLESKAYSQPCETLTRHIRNPAIVKTAYLVSHIQTYLEPSVTHAYAEIWHIRNPGTFRATPLLHSNAYLQPCHIHKNR